MNWFLFMPVLLPVIGALNLLLLRWYFPKQAVADNAPRFKLAVRISTFCFVLAAGLSVLAIALDGTFSFRMFDLISGAFPIYFRADITAIVFASVAAVMWLLSTWFSFAYMDHQKNEIRYQLFSLLSLGAVLGVCFSGNLITTYLFYEMMTLVTFPLVLHEQTKEAVSAGMTYLFYSVAGAFLGLLGIFFLSREASGMTGEGGSLMYRPGGFINVSGDNTVLLTVLFLMLIGLACKAGMFPLHGWLPKAHPVAPAPASALLSGNITKMGLLFTIRVLYFIVVPESLSGTWVMNALLALSLTTVFLGSMLAYREKVLKKRLAYSTVSQVSYCLTGVYMLSQVTLLGAVLHMIFHSIIKNLLFLSVGAVIFTTGKTRADEMKHMGKKMPVTMTCFTVAGLGLVGIPPLCGFISKWYLATGAIKTEIPVFSWLAPVVLLISALLTAGYLLTVSADAFFGKDEAANAIAVSADADASKASDTAEAEHAEAGTEKAVSKNRIFLLTPLVILAAAALVFGIIPNPLSDSIQEAVDRIFMIIR